MREISFVKKLKFNFDGSVTKRALVFGDADNDKHNELVCANLQGELAIFKEDNLNKYAYARNLDMVTACLVGDVINGGMNYIAAINTEGWLFIFHLANQESLFDQEIKQASGLEGKEDSKTSAIKLNRFYEQRMPANCKELLLADLDGDGQEELIVGLTDRVLRTYKWIKIGHDRGKFVGLYKWEFADQIGAVSLNPSQHENCQDIIVAQPGGTYAKLECFNKKNLQYDVNSEGDNSKQPRQNPDASTQETNIDNSTGDSEDNVRTEYISKLTPEYHQLALSQMRNHHISTEALGGIRHGKNSDLYNLIVIATLDGTLMLVNKDEILWSLQVDHQLFALAVIEVDESSCKQTRSRLPQSESTCTIVLNTTDSLSSIQKLAPHHNKAPTNGRQYFVACAWNGKTYIIDEERNCLRFKFDEAVSAFTAGTYYFNNSNHASLVYATFDNEIVIYYDVIIDDFRPVYLLNEVLENSKYDELLRKLKRLSNCLYGESDIVEGQQTMIHNLMRELLYNMPIVCDDER